MSHIHLEKAVHLYFTRQATKIVGSVWLASQSIWNLLHKSTSWLLPQTAAARMIAERCIDLSNFFSTRCMRTSVRMWRASWILHDVYNLA